VLNPWVGICCIISIGVILKIGKSSAADSYEIYLQIEVAIA
jgi:hypothetical protein